MRKPPCPKCQARNMYLHSVKVNWREEVYLGCFVCGWRLYGEDKVTEFVMQYTDNAAKAEAFARAEELEGLRVEEENALREENARREAEALRKDLERKARALRLVSSKIPGFPYLVGEQDPILQLSWAGPTVSGDLSSCAWPPCRDRARAGSVYCSRKCGVRVAHRRDSLRKKGLLPAKKASNPRKYRTRVADRDREKMDQRKQALK